MVKRIQALGKHVANNKGAWTMAVINILASGVIATGGYDISQNKTEIDKTKETTGSMHRRITEQQVELIKLQSQVNMIKETMDKTRTEYREDMHSITRRLDSIARNKGE